ncbi:hypothetical protein SGLAM104S_02078 [Streptomyces glaucescens]
MDSEYWRLGLPEEIGGTTSPRSPSSWRRSSA